MQVDLTPLEQLNCQYAFYYHLNGNPPLLRANCERFAAASLIKIPILLAWVTLERQGQVDRCELCDLDQEPEVQGAGFVWQMTSRKLSFQDVLLMMLAVSDNLCANLVMQRIGMERLNHIIRDELDLTGTQVNRKMMDLASRSRGIENWITVQDCVRLFDLVHGLSLAEKAWVEPALLACQDSLLLARNIPVDSLEFYHKTGSISRVLHDWGYTPACDIFLLTQQVDQELPVFKVFGQMGLWMVER